MWRAITENLSWKLFSIVLAAVLWYALAKDDLVSLSIRAPIQYRNLSPNLEFASDIPDAVQLEINGPSRKLSSGALSNAAVSIDLDNVQVTGVQTFTVSRSLLRLPPGVTLTRAVPSQIRVNLEQRLTKQVPVKPNCVGQPPSGLVLQSCEAIPAMLTITGPKSHVEKMQQALTVPVDLSQVRSTVSQQVYSIIDEPQVRFADKSAVSVKIVVAAKAP
jgi:YbbR domain-containing protein